MANSALPQKTLTHRVVLRNLLETNTGKSLGNARLEGKIAAPRDEFLIFDPPEGGES